jgi:hypothetical protein
MLAVECVLLRSLGCVLPNLAAQLLLCCAKANEQWQRYCYRNQETTSGARHAVLLQHCHIRRVLRFCGAGFGGHNEVLSTRFCHAACGV